MFAIGAKSNAGRRAVKSLSSHATSTGVTGQSPIEIALRDDNWIANEKRISQRRRHRGF
jgi:hypothetical protein